MEAEGQIVRAEAYGQRALITREQLQAEIEQRTLLGQYVKECMVPGEDYGVIPGTKKPTLLKPGAEKLIALFHCSPEFELIEKTEDYERGFFSYMFRARVLSSRGGVVAEGFGSANSKEARYRWRDGKRKCPSCDSDAALLKSKKEGEGFFCWSKKGGCGATFKEEDKRITEQQVGRVENPDIYDLANTILKMAKKRAQVDAAIALARCSDMFTQDVEDFAGGEPVPEPSTSRGEAKPAKERPTAVDPERLHAASEAPGKPVEQPSAEEARKRSPDPISTVVFGPYKGKAILDLNVDQLRESIRLGKENLEKQPKAKWAPSVKVNVAEMEIALTTLQVEPEKSEYVEPLTEETAAKVDRSKEYVAFGTYSGKRITQLADDEVGLAGEEVTALLGGAEGQRWDLNKVTQARNVALLLALELNARMARFDTRQAERIAKEMRVP